MTDQRYSVENWKVLYDLKEERKKLQEFKDNHCCTAVTSAPYKKDKLDSTGHSEESFNSCCSHKACRNLLTGVEFGVLDGKSIDHVAKATVEIEHNVGTEQGLDLKYLCHNTSDSTQEAECLAQVPPHSARTVDSIDNSTDTLSELIHHRAVPLLSLNIPTALTCAVAALFEVKPFLGFMKGQRKIKTRQDDSSTPERKALILMTKIAEQLYFNKGQEERLALGLLSDLAQLMSAEFEGCADPLEELFQMLHQALVKKKGSNPTAKVCLAGCRQKSRTNHSIISHLFRGYFKVKGKCPCGSVITEHQTFSVLNLPQQSLEWHTIAVSHFDVKTGTLIRYLFQVNKWTTSRSLLARLAKNIGKGTKDMVLAMVKDECILSIKENGSLVLDAREIDYHLWTFECISVEQLPNDVVVIQQNASTEDEYPFTSTPAESEISEPEGKLGPLQSKDGKKRRNVIPVNILSVGQGKKEDAFNLPVVCKSQTVVRLQDVLRAIQRYMRINVSWNSSRIYLKDVKAMLCMVCHEDNCCGCHINENYLITGNKACCLFIDFYMPLSHISKISVSNDISYSLGVPCKLLLLEEMIHAFLTRTERQKCARCDHDTQHQMETRILKYPEVLAMKLVNRNSVKTPLMINSTITLDIGRLVNKQHFFRLVALVANENGERSLLVKKKGIGLWMKVSKAEGAVACNSPPESGVELALYSSYGTTKASRSKKFFLKGNLKPTSSFKVSQYLPTTFKSVEVDRLAEECNEMPSQGCAGESKVETESYDGVSSCNCTRCQCIDDMSRQIKSIGEAVSSLPGDNHRHKVVFHSHISEKLSPSDAAKELQNAILRQDMRRAIQCLKAGAKADFLINGVAAMHLAAGMAPPKGYIFTRLLLDHGCDPNVETDEGYTPLALASMWHREETMRLLTASGGIMSENNPRISSVQNEQSWIVGSYLKEGSSEQHQVTDGDTNSNTLLLDINSASYRERHSSAATSPPPVTLTTLVEEPIEEIEYNPRSYLKVNCSNKVLCCGPSLTHRLRNRLSSCRPLRRALAFVIRNQRNDL